MPRAKPEKLSIPTWILRDAAVSFDLTPAQYALLIAMAAHRKPNGEVLMTDRRAGEWTNLSRPTIQRARSVLLEHQLIYKEGVRAPGKAQRYTISERMPVPPQVLPMPTRTASHIGSAWLADPEKLAE